MSCAVCPSRGLFQGLIVTLLLGGASLAQAQTSSQASQHLHAGASASHAIPAHPALPPPPPTPTKAEASYNIGLSFGTQLHGASLSLKTLSIAELNKGLRDALGGKRFDRKSQQIIQLYVIAIRRELGKQNIAKATAFLARNGKKPGVITTASGLQYKILTPGSGTPPTRTDTVTVSYKGTLLDGTEFDGTDRHGGQPASFPLGTVIRGWQEALSLMKPGARWEIYIPPDLAYGAPGRGPIPPGSLLKFDVQLIKVTKPTMPRFAPQHPMVPQHPLQPHP